MTNNSFIRINNHIIHIKKILKYFLKQCLQYATAILIRFSNILSGDLIKRF